MSYESFQRAVAANQFRRICNAFEIKDMDAAFDGDVDAAFSLSCTLNNSKRGLMAVAMWRGKVPRAAFRAFLSSVWNHDHREVIEAAETRRTLGHMFRYAAFPLPAELPDLVTVWRGTSYLPFSEAKLGYSWTNDRDVACWFAMRFAKNNGSPLVLTAEIAKTAIALFTSDRNESEAVLIRPPAARIDGDVRDWTACAERKQDALNIARKAMLNMSTTE